LRGGLSGRVRFLFLALLLEGFLLMLFSRMDTLAAAILVLVPFSMFVQMAEGATFGIVPFVNHRALGTVAGVVGAGGNLGAVAAGFLFRAENIPYADAFLYLGLTVAVLSVTVFTVRFSPADEARQQASLRLALDRRRLSVESN